MGKFSLNDLLNEQSKQPKAQQPGDIQKILLSKIRPSSMNKYSIEQIEELAANIEMVGLLHNLVLTAPDAEGIHNITSGERRYWACKMLVDGGNDEFAAVDCRISAPGESDTVTELKLLFANALARDLSDYEKTYQAGRIKELLLQLKAEGYKFKGRMRDTLASLMSVSPAQMGRMESINKNLSDDFKEEFKAGNIGISAAYDISTMPADEQAAAHEQYKDTGMVPTKPKPTVEDEPASAAAPEPAKAGVSIAEGLHHPERVPTEPPAQSGPEPEAPAPKMDTPPCSTAEKQGDGKCLGFSSGGDDEPIDRCKACESHTLYDADEAPEPPQETRSIDHAVCPACGCTFNPADVVGSLDRIITSADVSCPHCAALLEVGMSIEWICSIAESEGE